MKSEPNALVAMKSEPNALVAMKSEPNAFSYSRYSFARLHSREKCLWASSPSSVALSVRLSLYIRAAPSGPICLKFDIGEFYGNLLCGSTFGWKRAKISDALHED
jgi:hypothetical protein